MKKLLIEIAILTSLSSFAVGITMKPSEVSISTYRKNIIIVNNGKQARLEICRYYSDTEDIAKIANIILNKAQALESEGEDVLLSFDPFGHQGMNCNNKLNSANKLLKIINP